MERLSRTTPLIAAQGILNAFLAFWLFMEYVHNRFLREYLAGFWTTNYLAVIAVFASGGVGVGGLYYLTRRREFAAGAETRTGLEVEEYLSSRLLPLDVCPFCNVALKALSEDRFQCRRCGRYFKK